MPLQQAAAVRTSKNSLKKQSSFARAKQILRRYVGFEWTRNGFHWMQRNVDMIDADSHAEVKQMVACFLAARCLKAEPHGVSAEVLESCTDKSVCQLA